jgi:hypothetical protein
VLATMWDNPISGLTPQKRLVHPFDKVWRGAAEDKKTGWRTGAISH